MGHSEGRRTGRMTMAACTLLRVCWSVLARSLHTLSIRTHSRQTHSSLILRVTRKKKRRKMRRVSWNVRVRLKVTAALRDAARTLFTVDFDCLWWVGLILI